jgi:diguanylate cyclase (GGDEF)-like protein
MKKSIFSKGVIAALSLIGIIWPVLFYMVASSYEQEEKEYLKTEVRLLESIIRGTTKTYEMFSAYIYEEVISKKEVLNIVSEAYHTDSDTRDRLRKQLFDLLQREYKAIHQYEFGQMQFHFPNGESFLRFNDPEEYGDPLFDIRETVRIANTKQRYVFGFEVGRFFDGFRFVYPLFLEEQHVGSVELAVSLNSSIEILRSLYPDNNIIYILERNEIDKVLTEQYRSGYATSFISPDYVIDKEVFGKLFPKEGSISLFQYQGLMKEIQDRAKCNLGKKEAFSITASYNHKQYLVHFLPIESCEQELAGYYISLYEDDHIAIIKRQKYIALLLLSIMALMLATSVFLFSRDKSRIYKMASTDSLTGIFNRRHFLSIAQEKVTELAKREGSLGVIMLDIDHFKRVNDTFGHDVGDAVLKTLTLLVTEAVRASDVFARWGGEEFIVLISNLNGVQTVQIAERIRQVVEQYSFEIIGKLTISLGVSMIQQTDESIDSVINRADDALYQAKQSGRNKVCLF